MKNSFLRVSIGVFIISALVVSSCYQRNAEEFYPSNPSGQNCDTTNVTFSGTVQPIINAKCATSGCHNDNSTGYNLSTYGGVKAIANSNQLMNSILRNGQSKPMPQGEPKLDDCSLVKIQKWVNDGAPNN